MIVRAHRFDATAGTTTRASYTDEMLLQTPGTGNDINRVLGMHPAALSVGTLEDDSLSVRRGSEDENVYLVNGIELESINHFSSNGAMSPT